MNELGLPSLCDHIFSSNLELGSFLDHAPHIYWGPDDEQYLLPLHVEVSFDENGFILHIFNTFNTTIIQII